MDWCLIVQLGVEKQVVPLTPGSAVTLGRHRSNTVVLPDEHCSRRHAEVYSEQGGWFVRDMNSQNGTFVDGKKVQAASLSDGQLISVGQARVRFCRLSKVQEEEQAAKDEVTSTTESVATLLLKSAFAADQLSALCSFMADAVDKADSRDIVRLALETIRSQTRADVVGFLGLHEEGKVLPRLILPDSSEMDMPLSQRLTAEIGHRRQSLWLAQEREQAFSATASLAPFRDAIGVPLLSQDTLLGVLHAYRNQGAFNEPDFQFCEIVSHFLAAQLRLGRLRQQLTEENQRLRRRVGVDDQLLGDSPILQRLRTTIERVAPLPSTVLIQGESGVGKELVAQALHRRSKRSEAPFVVMNCAAIPATLLESQLFGHKKGAFTDARTDQEGYLARADGGTLFLDEIGEFPPECQTKLLRVLEGHSFTRLGDTEEHWVDVRFLAATNRDLQKEVRDGRFRSDLYYRLHVVVIAVPPLRDHLSDVSLLAAHFLERVGAEYGRKFRLSPHALDRLNAYSWPGNVRQLRHVLESAAAQAEGEIIDVADLRFADKETGTALPTLNLKDLERLAVGEAFRRADNQVTEAANLLGLARSTLYEKAKNMGLIS